MDCSKSIMCIAADQLANIFKVVFGVIPKMLKIVQSAFYILVKGKIHCTIHETTICQADLNPVKTVIDEQFSLTGSYLDAIDETLMN